MKEILRDKYSRIRDNIGGGFSRAAADKACAQLLSNPRVTESEHILVYVSTGSELPTLSLIKKLIEAGKKVYVPVMEDGVISAARLIKGSDLEPGAYGIPEIPRSLRRCIEPGKLDAAIIPGVCFSTEGKRLGRGGGHFDRYLSKTQAYKIGLCYSRQLFEDIPEHEHDVRVDEVITEIPREKLQKEE